MTLVFAWRSQDGTRGRKPMPAEGYGSQAVKPAKAVLAVTPGNGENSVAWTDGDNGGAPIIARKLYRSTTSNFNPGPANLLTDDPGDSPYVDTNVSNGQNYFYKMVITNAKGDSLASDPASGTPQPSAPAAPGIVVTSGKGFNSIAWTDGANGGSPISSHRIYRSTTIDFQPGPSNRIASPAGASPYVDANLDVGTPYYYRVEAVNGVGPSEPSVEATGTPTADAPEPPVLSATPGIGTVTIAWTDGDDGGAPVILHRLYRSTVASFVPGPSNLVAEINDPSPYLDTGLSAGATYYYYLVAVNLAGPSDASNRSQAAPTAAPTAPSAPLLTVSAGIGQNTLSWTDQSDGGSEITGHKLYRSTTNNFTAGPSNLVGTIMSDSPYIDMGLTNGVTYYYRLRAVNAVDDGSLSDQKSGMPQAAPSISLSPITAVAEGSSGAPGVFTISATRTTTSGPASVSWAVSAGFAGNPVDVADFGGTFPSGSLNFADGSPTATTTFTVAGDNVVEPDETGLVTISSPTSPYTIATATQPFLVVNDDSYPTMSLNTIAPRAEGSSAFPAVVNISVVRSNSVGAASCNWAVTAGGGANPLSAADFQGGVFPSGTINWLDGQTTASASFTMVGDSVIEPDETGLVTISSPSAGYVIGTAQQPFTIQDDDAVQPLSAPILSGLGASRVRQSLVQSGSLGANLNSNHVVGGMMTWIQALDPRYIYTNWIEQTAPYINSSYHDGLTFASDGEGFPQMRLRVPKLRASRSNIVMMDLSSNSVNGPYDLATYCNQAKELITLLRAVGKIVGVLSLVERVSTTGGLWAVGQQWRTNVPTINAEMESWCATQQGVFYVDIRSVLVDLVDSAHEPLAISRGNAYDATRDGTHWSQRGAYEAAKKWNTAAAPFITGSTEASRANGANKYSNPNFTGSGAVASQANLSGVQPTNCVVSYGSSNASVVAMSLVDKGGGKFAVRATINRSAMADGVVEAIALNMVSGVSALTAASWYTAGIKATTNNAPGLATIACSELSDSSGKASRGGSGINGGGSSTLINYVADLPGEVRTAKFETSSMKANTTTPSTFTVRAGWAKGDGSTLVIDFFDPFVIPVDDPHLLMFDNSDVSTPTITSASTASYPEESTFTFQAASSKPGYWSLSGADAALFSITPWGELKNRNPLDYENPTDADKDNIYSLNKVLTPFDIRDAVVTKALAITTTDIDDGFTDIWARTVGSSVGAEGNWTGAGGLRAQDFQIATSNRVSIITTGTSDKTLNRLAPQQFKDGNPNYEQRISFNRGVTASAAFPYMYIQFKDDFNFIAVKADVAGFLSLWRREPTLNGGAATKIGTYAYDDEYGISFDAQRLGTEIQVFQGKVRMALASGTETVGTILQDAVRSGFGNGGAANFLFGPWNNRNAAPLVSKIGLKKLTPAVTSISVADAASIGVSLNNLTDGSGRAIKTVTGTGSGNAANVLADGSTVKIKEGAAGQTYIITVTETPSDPANTVPSAGRDSTLATITLT